MNAERLNRQFAHVGGLRFEADAQGLLRAHIETDEAEATVYLQGAQVTHYRPRKQKRVLFLSEQNRFMPGRAIRGGIPVIFPWFGPHPRAPEAPAHGFARTLPWRIEDAARTSGGGVQLSLELSGDGSASPFWPQAFALRYRVIVGAELGLQLEVRNTGTERIHCEAALHTYLAVGDVRHCALQGLEGTEYLDKLEDFRRKRQEGTLRFTGAVDRVYVNTTATCVVEDVLNARRIVIEKRNSASTVVWNPWEDKARLLPDLGDAEWPSMLCVETANVGEDAISLAADAAHTLHATVRVEPAG